MEVDSLDREVRGRLASGAVRHAIDQPHEPNLQNQQVSQALVAAVRDNIDWGRVRGD